MESGSGRCRSSVSDDGLREQNMDGFTFYKSFYDTIKKMKKEQDRIKTVYAVIEYMFDDVEPNGLSEVAEIAFESFKHTLDKSKNNGGSARAKRKSKDNQNEKTIPKRFENDSEKKESKDNQNEIVSGTSSSLSLSSKERLIDNQWKENGSVAETINQTIEESVTKNTPLSAFLKANPSIQVDITSMSLLYGKDFELLSLKFRESRYLQEKTNSLSWVCRSYTDIVCDKYKDKTVNQTGEKGGWEEMDLPRKKVIGYHSDPKITGEEL